MKYNINNPIKHLNTILEINLDKLTRNNGILEHGVLGTHKVHNNYRMDFTEMKSCPNSSYVTGIRIQKVHDDYFELKNLELTCKGTRYT